MAKSPENWISKATDRMKAKGTVGSFGAATNGKIAAAKKQGGKMEKKAIFAQNMARIASKHRGKRIGGK